MRFPSGLVLLPCGLLPLAFAHDAGDNVPDIERRSLTPIGLSTLGAPFTPEAPTTSSFTSSLASTSSSTLRPTTAASPTTAPTTTRPPSTYTGTQLELVVTEVFTQPPDCVGGATQYASTTDEFWQNIIVPYPGVTVSSCYPSKFFSSAQATASLPPFLQLVCPHQWESYPINSTYIICCPKYVSSQLCPRSPPLCAGETLCTRSLLCPVSDFGIYAPNFHDKVRPGRGAVCTSNIWPQVLVDVTSYRGSTWTVRGETAGTEGTLVVATAFEGVKATYVVSDQPSPTRQAGSTTEAPPSSGATGASSTATTTSSGAPTASPMSMVNSRSPMAQPGSATKLTIIIVSTFDTAATSSLVGWSCSKAKLERMGL